jgi:hypothetical protein
MESLLKRIIALLLAACPFAQAGDSWSIEYHRGLSDRQRGDLLVTLYGSRVFSHAFQEPAETFFDEEIPKAARVELVYTITETEGTAWGGNPYAEDVPETPARIGVILHRDWTGASGRWYSLQRIDVRPGVYRMVIPVEPWAWKNVMGKIGNESPSRKEQWRNAWSKPARIGVCAGGFFHAHGIEVIEGVGTIKVNSLRVLPK